MSGTRTATEMKETAMHVAPTPGLVGYVIPGGRYAWVIDIDHLHDINSELYTADYAGTIKGDSALRERLKDTSSPGAPEGDQFGLYDAAGELMYTGRILVEGDTAPVGAGTGEFLAPLTEFGQHAGAIEIHYYDTAVRTSHGR